ncbi:MAG TPA: hypothetical protein VL240_14080 [Candidatus Binatia bacterium]|nr:hypothetical protein [Candidatus Binatia bacterium]
MNPLCALRVLAVLLLATVPQQYRLLAQQPARSGETGDISGMYSFLREGEFVQLTVEDGKLSGYISRFGDSASDKDQFIDQFFDRTSLAGNRLSFSTKTVHGVWFEFAGVIATAPGRKPSEEGYHVIKGTLIQHTSDATGTEKSMQRQVEFKSFPPYVNKP